MLPYTGGLAGFVPDLLGTIIFTIADQGHYQHLAAVNLSCSALHQALPLAFSSTATEEGEDAFVRHAAGVHQALCQQVEKEFGASRYLQDRGPNPSTTSPIPILTLRLNLHNLASASLSGLSPSTHLDSVRRTARRFSASQSLQLQVQLSGGALGAHLFTHHVAPLMHGVRQLTIRGPWEFSLPAFWRLPEAAAFSDQVTQLCVSGHHSGLVPLAAELPACFPSINALYLAVNTCWARPDGGSRSCDALTVAVPPGLRVLLINLRGGRSTTDNDEVNDGFRVTMAGSLSQLHHLGITSNIWDDMSVAYRRTYNLAARPVILLGEQLPALRHLDLPFYPRRPLVCGQMSGSLLLLCPGLVDLVLNTTRDGMGYCQSTCAAFLASLAPLTHNLRRLEVQMGDKDGSERCTAEPEWLQAMVSQALPGAQLLVSLHMPSF